MIGLIEVGLKILDRILPDNEKKAAAQLELLKLQQSGELQVIAQQLEINKIEAANPSVFVSGWRPGLGWVLVASFATQFLIGPLGSWVALFFGKSIQFPQLDMPTFMPVLLGMLGLAGFRSYEKVQGVASK